MTKESGVALRDAGMKQATDAQNRAEPSWGDRAFQAIVRCAKSNRFVHVDMVLAIFPDQPAHPNAWGAVWRRAMRGNIITRSGEMRATTQPGKHAHSYPVYASQIFGS